MNGSSDNGVEVRLDVPYGGGPDGDLSVDIYRPSGPGPHPALLCLHGGAWLHGAKGQYESWGPYLAARGYAVVAVDYRLSSQVSSAWPGVWDDVRLALNWLIANAAALEIDSGRIGAVGDSVGGLMAAMLTLDDRTAPDVRAVVGVYGVYDLPAWWQVTQARDEDPVAKLLARSYREFEAVRAACESFSPVHRLRARGAPPAAPYLLIYGDQDTRVPHVQSEIFLAALREAGGEVEVLPIPGAGHSWFTYAKDHAARRRVDEEPNVTVAPELLRFLERALSA